MRRLFRKWYRRFCRVTVLPIRITGDPVLHEPATPVVTFDEAI